MIALVVVGIAFTAFLYLSAPSGIAPMYPEPPIGIYVLYGLAAVGVVVGLIWMIRISRVDPEPAQHAWRYRAKR